MQFKNIELYPAITFLSNMTLSGRASLGRSALKEKLLEKQDAYAKAQMEVVDEFEGWIDKEEGRFSTDNPELNQANNDLGNQDIDVTVESPFFNDFLEALENYDEEMSGSDADVYAKLYQGLVGGNEGE